MKNHHIVHKGRARVLVLVLAGFVMMAMALLWGWNTFAVEVLGQQTMRFKHALALEVLLLSVAGVFPVARRLFGHCASSSR
jgi:hypothetical protein